MWSSAEWVKKDLLTYLESSTCVRPPCPELRGQWTGLDVCGHLSVWTNDGEEKDALIKDTIFIIIQIYWRQFAQHTYSQFNWPLLCTTYISQLSLILCCWKKWIFTSHTMLKISTQNASLYNELNVIRMKGACWWAFHFDKYSIFKDHRSHNLLVIILLQTKSFIQCLINLAYIKMLL